MKGVALLASVLALSLHSGEARITDATVEHDDRGIILLATPFGFSQGGHVDIDVRDFKAYASSNQQQAINYTALGFFLTTPEAELQLEIDLKRVYTALADRITDFTGGISSLFYANCAEEPTTLASFDIKVALYNVKANGRKDYLAVGEDLLPLLYMVMFVLFAVATTLWSIVVFRARADRHRVHYLMTALAAAKTLTLLSLAGMLHFIQATGRPDGWNIAYYVFTFLRGLLFFTVVVLVGTGWSYIKPLLATREKRILMVVIPLQVCAEVAIVVMDENTPVSRAWFTWRDILHLVDIVCCCAVLFPIVWSIKHLRDASQTDGKAAKSLAKLQLFRHFYVAVVCYIYFTRIIVYLLRSGLPYQWTWLSDAADQIAALLFYTLTAVFFRPHAANPYLALGWDDDLAAENELQTQPKV